MEETDRKKSESLLLKMWRMSHNSKIIFWFQFFFDKNAQKLDKSLQMRIIEAKISERGSVSQFFCFCILLFDVLCLQNWCNFGIRYLQYTLSHFHTLHRTNNHSILKRIPLDKERTTKNTHWPLATRKSKQVFGNSSNTSSSK